MVKLHLTFLYCFLMYELSVAITEKQTLMLKFIPKIAPNK